MPMILQLHSVLRSVVLIVTLSLPINAMYNDTLTCEDPLVANITQEEVLLYGQCLTFRRERLNRQNPCEVFYEIDVDRVFLPAGRALNNLSVMITFAADANIVKEILQEPCRDAALRGLCYYYFPPCGNITHFEPPSSLCMSACQYIADAVCHQHWLDAIRYFENYPSFKMYQVDILNCSDPDGPMDQFPHCCSDAGIKQFVALTTTVNETSSSDPNSESTESSSNLATAIIVSSMTVVMVIVTLLVIVFITVMLAKKYGLSKVALQVTTCTDSIDNVGEQTFSPIIVHRYKLRYKNLLAKVFKTR